MSLRIGKPSFGLGVEATKPQPTFAGFASEMANEDLTKEANR